jgi:DNA-binding Xre family transcriptional regulator
MKISYKPLWKLLIDREMSKKDLRIKTGLSIATVAKMVNCENIQTNILVRICEALECGLADIMELEK